VPVAVAAPGNGGPPMTEKQKRIADLKASLLAPQIRQLPKRAAAANDGKDDPMD
tara:strand:+ start:368 stop:529 length:162 start_codon:yes stop_codon:yes gene_type:complete